MGEASSRKAAARAAAAAISAIDKSKLAQAVVKTMCAVTDLQGADCLGYAIIGTGLLNRLGVPARAVAGQASWRVGPGDGDMVVHDPAANAVTVHHPMMFGDKRAAMFHAWIELDGTDGLQVIDLTTFQLQDKARALDALDGGRTQVDFCPEFIWEKAPPPQWTSKSVAQAPQGGVFSYRRDPRIEGAIFSHADHESMLSAISAAALVYQKLLRNEDVVVIGVDGKTAEMQTQGPSLSDSIANRDLHGEEEMGTMGIQKFTKRNSP